MDYGAAGRGWMDNVRALQTACKTTRARAWLPCSSSKTPKTLSSKTLITIPFPRLTATSFSYQPPSAPPLPPHAFRQENYDSARHTTLLLESYHRHQRLKSLLRELGKKRSCPLEMLQGDGDWPADQFWAVIRFLVHSSRSQEVLQVFNMWKGLEESRINEFNYEKIIGLLCEEGLLEDAITALTQMKSFGLSPSLQIYNSLIHGFARNGKFDDASFYLDQMKEINLSPESETYDGLIRAYGKHKMYDEMGMCFKQMELDGCSPDCDTYNLLIQEFARAGLLSRMEKTYQSMRTKKMNLQSYTLFVMLEAYANCGIVEKMEKILRRVWKLEVLIKEDLVRKVAGVYIQNYMFSRLDDLGDDLTSKTGRTDLVWCLRLLSHACHLSRRGMDSIVRQMEEVRFPWNVTTANIILLAYLKMKDFTRLRSLLSSLPSLFVEPDIVTVGILFDASSIGFDGSGTVETWRRMGVLYRCAEMNTDPLVLTAFGKGQFLRKCEEVYSSLDPKAREKKKWTYHNLIELVDKQNEGGLSSDERSRVNSKFKIK